jgi:hypothetical protein
MVTAARMLVEQKMEPLTVDEEPDKLLAELALLRRMGATPVRATPSAFGAGVKTTSISEVGDVRMSWPGVLDRGQARTGQLQGDGNRRPNLRAQEDRVFKDLRKLHDKLTNSDASPIRLGRPTTTPAADFSVGTA